MRGVLGFGLLLVLLTLLLNAERRAAEVAQLEAEAGPVSLSDGTTVRIFSTGATLIPERFERCIRAQEIIVNGEVVAKQNVEADGRAHDLRFDVPINQSSWVALRQFPQLHTNPVTVLVGDKPVRCSRDSAMWCAESVRRLWHNRRRFIAEAELPAAEAAYRRSLERFFTIADESTGGDRVARFELLREAVRKGGQ